MDNAKAPKQIKLLRKEGILNLSYADKSYDLTAEYLRVLSPSAEVKGHGPGEEVLQTGKKNVKITKLEPMGHYALRITFDDGHDSGIFSWGYLYDLCINHDKHWQAYLDQLSQAGKHREPDVQVVQLMEPNK